MVRLCTLLIYIALACSAVSTGWAASHDDVRLSINNGEYDQAFSLGEDLGDNQGLLLAAEALNTKILIGSSNNVKRDAKRAMKLSERVLEQDEAHKKAKLLYAVSYGFYGRSASPFKAWRKKLPQKIKAAIDQAYIANPDEARSFALIGAWHMSVSARAGSKTAKKYYGASIEDGVVSFEQALRAAPKDILITGNYALMLYANAPDTHIDAVKLLLASVKQAQPKDMAEAYVLDYLSNFGNQLNQPEQAQKLAEDFLGW